MRKFKTEDELKAIARGMCDTIVDRVTDNTPKIRRGTTDEERETLYKIAYGTLLELNVITGHAVRNHGDEDIVSMKENVTIDTAEYIFGRFFPTCNSYDSFWIPLMKVLEKWEEESWEIPLAEWYADAYPHDDLAEYMNPEATFRNLYDSLEKGVDVYGIIGVGDSVVRERVFEGLANVCGKKYDEIYKMWLSKGRK